MRNQPNKEQAQFGINWAKAHIQEIEESNTDIGSKIDRVEFQLVLMLYDLVGVLPGAFRSQVQSCLDARDSLRDAYYLANKALDAAIAQKEASPLCLPASDSL
jgi:hypothetical protein